MSIVTPTFFEFPLPEHMIAGERWPAAEDGPPRPDVVLLHGGGQTRHSWKRTAERLSERGWGVSALDARGHGDSQWHPRQDYSLDGFVGDVLAYTATLERAPVLVGASLGGMTSLVIAGEHPDRVAGLVLVDIVVQAEERGVERIREFMTAHREGFASLQEVSDAIAAYNPNRPRPKNLEGLKKNVRQHEDGRWYWHWDPAFMSGTVDEPRRFAALARLRAAAGNVKAPTLLVRGLQSEVVSEEGLQDMLTLIPHAQVADVGAAGHMIAGDDNDVFTGQLETFLESLTAPAGH